MLGTICTVVVAYIYKDRLHAVTERLSFKAISQSIHFIRQAGETSFSEYFVNELLIRLGFG